MRLWTLHPKYLDARGLVALWREALLAQKVLRGETQGYRHHPQLLRFRQHRRPRIAIAAYLRGVLAEALTRGYEFNEAKILHATHPARISVSRGQLYYEWTHLRRKLRVREPDRHRALWRIKSPLPHPLFRIVAGPVEPWEIRK
jgi:pyrimidine dimer DNA glycosylase